MNEINFNGTTFKPIYGYKYYYSSACGTIISTNNNHKKLIGKYQKIVSTHLSKKTGYRIFGTYIDGVHRSLTVHRAVLLAFCGPCPNGFQGAHLDGDRNNNALPNLKWTSVIENNHHKYSHKTMIVGEKQHLSKLTEENILSIRKEYTLGNSKKLAKNLMFQKVI